DGGRGDGGRGEATRHSRRTQGLPAEEHKDLDVISRENRARKKAERDVKAAAEQEHKATENAAQDDQVSTEAADPAPSSSSKPGGVEEEQAHNPESAPASEGGANVGEPPAADRVSDSPPPDQDVEVLNVVPAKVKVEVILIEDSEAEAESALQDADASSRSPQSSSNPPPSSSQDQASGSGCCRKVMPRTWLQHLKARTREVQLDEAAAKNFVARQVYRWEQMRSERVVPPSVEYAWPTPRPDFTAWQETTMVTSDYLRNRMALDDRDAAWISGLRPERRVLGIAQDLTALAIPPAMMTARECAAVLETLLFEAGFEFVNAVPDWFLTHASKINPGYVRSGAGELQQVLTIELIEWKQLTAGVPYKVVPAVKPESAKDDLLMEDYKVELLGQAFVSQCRMAGIMALRSPRGSPENEPEPKRPQRRPARPLSISTPSDHFLVPSSNV
ncbi:hypothetical protein PHYSODRAFT_400389, partial [Phytophthora sojae]